MRIVAGASHRVQDAGLNRLHVSDIRDTA